MPDIVLTTLNAKYIHAAFGLRYLLANLGDLQPRAFLAEFDINQRPVDIAEALLARAPRIIGFGVYIWNVAQTTEVIAIIKRVRPDTMVVLGGPEVSYELDAQPIVALADHVITGEADLEFASVCRRLLAGEKVLTKVIAAPVPELSQVALPYDLYTEDDIAHRVLYVEASRGCPFTCEFCLSSLEIPVRQAPLDRLLTELQRLLERGARQFKFVDRTFNLNLHVSRALLLFFLERHRPDLFLHFEMIPDRLPAALREIIAQFPPGALQFEVGVQSFNDEVCRLISRRQDVRKLEENFVFLRERTGVHVHADLIAGLPGESVESFASGFDRLVTLGPQEIQVGILKRLRGTPIVRHDAEWQMRYSPHPPYEILQTRLIDFSSMQRLRRFAKYWDLIANSGNFVETTKLLWEPVGQASSLSRQSETAPVQSGAVAEPEATAPPETSRMPVLPSIVGQASSLSRQSETERGQSGAVAKPDAAALAETGRMPVLPFIAFDRMRPVAIRARHLPHRRQDGATYFVTFRLADSIPQEKWQRWQAERAVWLRAHPEPHSEEDRREYQEKFMERFQQWLDAGDGSCSLRQATVADLVENALRFFDGQRYRLGHYVVMPNHVHVLVQPLMQWQLSGILHSWKSFTANKANQVLGRTGKLWQDEFFDHIVRNAHQLEQFASYILENPRHARLRSGEFRAGCGSSAGPASSLSGPASNAPAQSEPLQRASATGESETGRMPVLPVGQASSLSRAPAVASIRSAVVKGPSTAGEFGTAAPVQSGPVERGDAPDPLETGRMPVLRSPFAAFLRFSDWLFARVGRTDSIALARLAEYLLRFLTEEVAHDPQRVAATLWRDWQRGGRRDMPEFLRALVPPATEPRSRPADVCVPKRQTRHLH